MLQKIVKVIGGDPNKRQVEKYSETVDLINSLEQKFEAFSEDQLRSMTVEFRRRLAQGETLDDILPEAFAVVREAGKRTLGQRHYDVQLIGGIALHQSKIAEMRTGEGKTLVATLPIYLNGLALNPEWVEHARKKWGEDPQQWSFEPLEGLPVGSGTHLITVNDYLARRDARWMGPIYHLLGLNVGVLQMASRTENGRKAFLVDFERESPHEDQHQLRMEDRREAYAADITYGTNSEFGFDYLRDNMAMRLEDRVQRGHHFAIVDEVDNVLIDEARTPLIISGPAQDDTEWYLRMAQVVKNLNPEDYEINERDRNISLTELGESHVERLLSMPLRDPDRPEDVTPEQARIMGYLEQALRAQYLFKRNKDYLVQAGKVIIIDEFTGRLMPGRRWSDGLHQAVEAKEGAKVQRENVTYATITIQNYFRMYEKLAGMTGTAMTEAEEFDKIYKLDVLAIPTNLEYMASRADAHLIEIEDRDQDGYKYQYYALQDDLERKPIFWKRKDHTDMIYRTEEAKLRAIAEEIIEYHVLGRPILVGTTSVELSERVSNRLRAEPLRRLVQVLLLRHAWMKKNHHEEDGRAIPELAFLNQPLEQLPLPDMRKMARELEIPFNPEAPENIELLLSILGLTGDDNDRLQKVLQAGIPHEVLNARKHTEESQIIAGAGAFGAVTIATNMAGRGVDIKLGGELAEEVITATSRVLRRSDKDIDPFDMTMEERRQALINMHLEEYGIYETEVNYFLQYMEDMERVRSLGGLHVVGSERHESRRIDNQLRGRAARQGDPGSSRFYLSMEDDLMRLFGGQQADNLMQRLRIDDALPLEIGLVGRIVEQSQSRVEGANFDVRKHLLEYDDVLNTQRVKIYAQRNRIFQKEDLSEDVRDMLKTEVQQRIPQALEDPEGPWKLLAWLDQIQPPLSVNGSIFPSYTLKLLLEQLKSELPSENSGDARTDGRAGKQRTLQALLDVAENALRAEEEHMLRTVDELLETTRQRLETTLKERLETIDTFFEGLQLEYETEIRSPRQLADELSSLVHVPLKLSSDELRTLHDDPEQVAEIVQQQVEDTLIDHSITRLVGAVERRLEEELDMNPAQLESEDWDRLADQVLDAIENVYLQRRERLIGQNGDGLIAKDLESEIAKVDGSLNDAQLLYLLLQMPQGARAVFDKRTHRRVWRRTTRLTYVYMAARFLDNREHEDISVEVLEHLEAAQSAMLRAWGQSEWSRLANYRPIDLSEMAIKGLSRTLGDNRFETIHTLPLKNLEGDERVVVIDELGRQALTEVYRQLLLGVISELWVEYLTNMEALRVSIGLEAYGQRDPLVQYKNRAFEMFQQLLSNMRMGVVTRMFTFQPRDLTSIQASTTASQEEAPEPQVVEEKVKEKKPSKAKRRRRRR